MLKIGQSQLRFEDDALITGPRPLHERPRRQAVRPPPFSCAAIRLRQHVSIDTEAAPACPKSSASSPAPTSKPLAFCRSSRAAISRPRWRRDARAGSSILWRSMRCAMSAIRSPLLSPKPRQAALVAAEAVMVEIEERPVVIDPLDAARPDAPLVWDEFPDNRCFTYEKGDKAGVEAAGRLGPYRHPPAVCRISRVVAAPIETRGAIASYDPATGPLPASNSAPRRRTAFPGDVAPILGVSPDNVHVVASRLRRLLRHEECRLSGISRPAVGRQTDRAAAALDVRPAGILPVRRPCPRHVGGCGAGARCGWKVSRRSTCMCRANLGAHSARRRYIRWSPISAASPASIARRKSTPRSMASLPIPSRPAPYRGAGRPEATYIIERMIDLAAYETGIDRRRTAATQPFRSRGDALSPAASSSPTIPATSPACLNKALEMADWAGFEARRAEANRAERLRGASASPTRSRSPAVRRRQAQP